MKYIITVAFAMILMCAIDSSGQVIQLLIEYEKECYADSTFTHTYSPTWNSGCFNTRGNLAIGYSLEIDCDNKKHYVWTHRDPTLKGFVEFKGYRELKLKGWNEIIKEADERTR